MSNFQPLEVVSRGSGTQFQVDESLNCLMYQKEGSMIMPSRQIIRYSDSGCLRLNMLTSVTEALHISESSQESRK